METIEHIPIKELKLDKNNPRKISKDQFEKLCKSIQDDPNFFSLRPCLVNFKEGVYHVYGGNQRIRAAKKLGWTTVPCIIQDDLSDEVMTQRVIKDNQHYGDWDFDILANDFDHDLLLECGFEEKDLGFTEEIVNNDEEEKEENIKTCPHCNGIL